MSKIAGILKDFFAAHQQKVFQATAPGRLDVMGGGADFAGALMIPQTLTEVSTAYIAFREDDRLSLRVIHQGEEILTYEDTYTDIIGNFPTLRPEYARAQIVREGEQEITLCLVGCLLTLFEERQIKREGLDIIIVSDIPLHRGLAAVASYEVALLKAVRDGLNLDLLEYDIPRLALKAKNQIGGFANGLGALLASYAGKHHKLTPMQSQPHEVFHPIDIPDALRFEDIACGTPTGLKNTALEDLRTAVFMGYTIIALNSGASLKDLEIAKETQNWSELPYGGYVANVDPSGFEDKFLSILPSTISGQEFFEKYKTIIDPVSFVDRDKEYQVLSCTKLPVYENFRVKLFTQIIKHYTTEFQNYSNRLSLMGELMYQSHQSYTDCGLGVPEADEIVRKVKEIGPKRGLYGARLTGYGNGGTVCILCGGIHGPEEVQKIRLSL